MDTEKIIASFKQQFSEISEDSFKETTQNLTIKHIKKNELIIHPNKKHNKISYIINGLVRAYLTKEDGSEIIVLFRKEKQFIASWESLFERRPAELTFQAIEPTIIVSISLDQLEEVMKNDIKVQNVFQEQLQKQIVLMMRHMQTFVYQTPEKRYLQLLNETPELVNRVSIKYIAQYLGIDRTSLSRIRKRLVKK